MEVVENTQNKVEKETEFHKSPVKDAVDNGGVAGDIASNNKPSIENNDVQQVQQKSKRMTKLEKMSQENAALLKELGVSPSDDNEDSGRRRTRSQARGVTTPAMPVEKATKRSRKSKEETDSASNKMSATPNSGESGQKRGRGRPPKNSPAPKKLKENDNVEEDSANAENNAGSKEVVPATNKNQEDKKEEKKVDKKETKELAVEASSEPEKPKEEVAPKSNAENGEKTEDAGKEKSSEPQPMDATPSAEMETQRASDN